MKYLLLFLLLLPVCAGAQINNIMARYPIDEPAMENLDDGIKGKWKFAEDTNRNNYYEVLRGDPYATDKYHIIFWGRGGTNAGYESNLHFSKIGRTRFINVPFSDRASSRRGYFFLKILDTDAGFTKMTAVAYNDTTLWNQPQEQIKKRISRNIGNPAYFRDTVHFYKVK